MASLVQPGGNAGLPHEFLLFAHVPNANPVLNIVRHADQELLVVFGAVREGNSHRWSKPD
jgi:hypothetical protein